MGGGGGGGAVKRTKSSSAFGPARQPGHVDLPSPRLLHPHPQLLQVLLSGDGRNVMASSNEYSSGSPGPDSAWLLTSLPRK